MRYILSIVECAFCGRKTLSTLLDVGVPYICDLCTFGSVPCAVCEKPAEDTLCDDCKADGYIVCSTCGAIYASLFCPQCNGGEE